MIPADSPPQTAFAYIAGVWDLDASRPGGKSHGLTNQIQVLKDCGCYADFTFSTIATPAQPSKVNSIYYVEDDPDLPKSHDNGIDSKVGMPVNDKLVIFQGPISITWNGVLKFGTVEKDPRFRTERIEKWIDANVRVHGRLEWVFVNDIPMVLRALKSCSTTTWNGCFNASKMNVRNVKSPYTS